MSGYQVGADTEALNNPTLRRAAEQIRAAAERYEAAVADVGQVVLHHRRSQLDDQVRKQVADAPEIVKNLLAGIERVSTGDVGATKDMADFFAKVEENAVTEAGGATAKPH